jgi:methyl-accepting chemotaxis protein
MGYEKDRLLKVLTVRYNMDSNSFQKYIDTTIAKSVSEKTVADIMEIVSEVQNAVNLMNECLTRTLNYIETDIAKDYDSFLSMADNYKLDAENFSDSMTQISNKITDLQESTTAISVSVEQISRTVGEAAEAVTTVAEKATDVANLSDGVVKVVSETEENSDELRDIKDSFKI